MYRRVSGAIGLVITSYSEDNGEFSRAGTWNNNAGTPVAVEPVLGYTTAD